MWRRLTVPGIFLFLAVDVFLVLLALRHTEGRPAPAGDAASATALPAAETPTSVPTAGPTIRASRVPASPAPRVVTAPVRFLTVAGDTVLRAPRGSCAGRRTVAVTVSGDRGATFASRRVTGLAEVLDVEAAPGSGLALVGLDRRCRPGRWTSRDGGVSWLRGPDPNGGWHLSADAGAASVASPVGPRRTPCSVRAVSAIGTGVLRVLCSDGGLLGTPDVGATWITLGRLAGAVDIRFTTPGDGVALAAQPGCPAAVLDTVDGGTTWSRLACLPGRAPRAVATAGDVVAAQVGRELYVSTDGGTTWPGAGGG